jgi:hypothetical protein
MLRFVGGVAAGLLLTASALVAQQAQVQIKPAPADELISGEIVRVDPVANKVVIRTGPASKVVEREYIIVPKARFLDEDDRVLADGIRARVMRPGARIRFRAGPRGITEFRMVRVKKK